MELSALSAAKKIAQLASKDKIKDLSPLKLQKILYFTEGNLMADKKVMSFFPETPEAWKYGPVYVDIYEKFKEKEYGEPVKVSDFDKDLKTGFDEGITKSIEATWAAYKAKTAGELVTITHRTTPWIVAKEFGYGSRISKEDMQEYFTKESHE